MRIKWFSLVRITGLLFVLLYHFYPGNFSGGFIGVDLFFTFSGYLITALFIDEFFNHGKITLRSFYQRRLFRIFPPLILMVLVCLPFAFLVSSDYIAALPQQLTSALSFVTNLFEIQNGGSYETQFIPHLFVHTWSLAIEVQFYLIWALVVAGLCRFLGKRTQSSKVRTKWLRISLFLLSLGLAGASFGIMVLNSRQLTEFSPIYFSTVAHSFPFFIGNLLASLTGIRQMPKNFAHHAVKSADNRKVIGLFGLCFILLLLLGKFLRFETRLTYEGGLFVASLLAGGMILAARILHEKHLDGEEPIILTYLANISYGVYLFHWPLYVIFNQCFYHVVAMGLTIGLSFIFATISFYVIEPLIIGKAVSWRWFHLHPKQLRYFSIGALPLVGVVGILVYQAPAMSALEKDLWISNVQQDVDRLQTMREQLEQQPASEYAFPKGVSIIGDSVTLGVRDYLLEHVLDSTVDGQINRNLNTAYDVMNEAQEQNLLREYVVIGIGNNPQYDYQEKTLQIVDRLASGHRLIFITPHDDRSNLSDLTKEQGNYYKELAEEYEFITIADWDSLASEHSEIFEGTDGIHFGGIEAGNVQFASCINQALAQAKEKAPKI